VYRNKRILVFLTIVLLCSQTAIAADYVRAQFPRALFDQIFDFRYANQLFRDGKFNESQNSIALLRQVRNENWEETEPLYDMYGYVHAERAWISKSDQSWAFPSAEGAYEAFREAVASEENIARILAPTLASGSGYHVGASTQSREDLASNLVALGVSGATFTDLQLGASGYFFEISALSPSDDLGRVNSLIIGIHEVHDSLFQSLNGLFIVSEVYYSTWPEGVEEVGLQEFLEHQNSFTRQLGFVYGIEESNYYLSVGHTCRVFADSLRLRDAPSISGGDTLAVLPEDTDFTILVVGEYAVVAELPGHWLRVKTRDGMIGWLFGSSAYVSFWPE
jgi:hypothetical protein